VHLVGAVYAESFIRAAGEDGLCVDTAKVAFVKAEGTTCASGNIPAASLPQSQKLYDALIDAFSMRTFAPVTRESGHGGTDPRHTGEWIDEVATRAAAQNEQYLELMDTRNFAPVAALAAKIAYHPDFAQYRELVLAHGFRSYLPEMGAHFDQAEAAPTGACLRFFPITHTQHQAPKNNTVSEWGTRHLHQSQTHHAKVTTVVVCQTQGSGSMTIKCYTQI